jgi:hypothetical protein
MHKASGVERASLFTDREIFNEEFSDGIEEKVYNMIFDHVSPF